MRSGRIGGYSVEEQESIKNGLISVLREIKISDSDIKDVLAEWHRIVEFDYVYAILGGSTIPDKKDSVTMAAWESLRDHNFSNVPTPEKIEKFLIDFGFMCPERREQLNDYIHYREHREHRRPDVWTAQESWGPLVTPKSEVTR